MNTRTPFTKPLTGQEMRYIQKRIDEVMHARKRHMGGLSTIDRVLLDQSQRPSHWPPLVEVPDHLQWLAAST